MFCDWLHLNIRVACFLDKKNAHLFSEIINIPLLPIKSEPVFLILIKMQHGMNDIRAYYEPGYNKNSVRLKHCMIMYVCSITLKHAVWI